MELLVKIGAVKKAVNEDGTKATLTLTALGYHLSHLPLNPRLGKMLILACTLQCLEPVLTVCAALSYKSPFMQPAMKDRDAATNLIRTKFGGSGELSLSQ